MRRMRWKRGRVGNGGELEESEALEALEALGMGRILEVSRMTINDYLIILKLCSP